MLLTILSLDNVVRVSYFFLSIKLPVIITYLLKSTARRGLGHWLLIDWLLLVTTLGRWLDDRSLVLSKQANAADHPLV